jgi:multiple sugar transport system permease protein
VLGRTQQSTAGRETPAVLDERKATPRLDRLRGRALPYILVIPSLLVMGVFILYPIAYAVWLSLHRVDYLRPQLGRPFIGLANYVTILSQSDYWNATWVTLIYAASTMIFSFLIGLGTALLLNQKFRGRIVARSIIILPWAIPYIAAILTWEWIFNNDYGILNYALVQLGIVSQGITWLVDPQFAMLAVLLVTIWTEYPFVTMMHLAGLQGISPEFYEAALIDGAGALDRFWHITLPGLSKVNTIIILLLAIWSFKRFTIIYAMTGGGPVRSTETLVIQAYRQAFTFYNMGYATAIGTIILLISLAFSLIYLGIQMRRGDGV